MIHYLNSKYWLWWMFFPKGFDFDPNNDLLERGVRVNWAYFSLWQIKKKYAQWMSSVARRPAHSCSYTCVAQKLHSTSSSWITRQWTHHAPHCVLSNILHTCSFFRTMFLLWPPLVFTISPISSCVLGLMKAFLAFTYFWASNWEQSQFSPEWTPFNYGSPHHLFLKQKTLRPIPSFAVGTSLNVFNSYVRFIFVGWNIFKLLVYFLYKE